MNWFWSLILPAGVQALFVGVGMLGYLVAAALPGTFIGTVCAVVASISGATALISQIKKESGKTDTHSDGLTEEKEPSPPGPPRPPGHVEGDPLPPQFPPGTEAGPEHSPYDPNRNPG